MPNTNNLTKQCELITELFHIENKKLRIRFDNLNIDLRDDSYIKANRFVQNTPIQNGELLGTGGMKHIYFIEGKALFLIPCIERSRLESIINEEVVLSKQLASLGLKVQNLQKGIIQIYDENEKAYYDYPCMYADAFTTLSQEQNMEVYDCKNRYRFGSINKLFKSDDDCLRDPNFFCELLQNLLHDLGLVLYSGLEVNENDSFNLIFLPPKTNQDIADVRLFLYDFSSKYYSPKLEPSFLKTLPADEKIKRILSFLISAILEADFIARRGSRNLIQPEFIYQFFQGIYPQIEDHLVNTVKDVISNCIKQHQQQRVEESLELSNSQSKAGYRQLNLYQPVLKEQTSNIMTTTPPRPV